MTTIPTAGHSVVNGFYSSTTKFTKRTAPNVRFAALDAAKGLAACIVVLHHLLFYSAATESLSSVLATPVNWLLTDARSAVQLFMVLGGFGLAWSQTQTTFGWQEAWQAFVKRYLRLAGPYLVMLAVLLLIARTFGQFDSSNPLVDSVSASQLLAHAFFAQGILGLDNLSAGVWYLCIDLQFALFFLVSLAAVSWLSDGRNRSENFSLAITAKFFAVCGLAAAFFWNRQLQLDWSVSYFFAPFVLGVLIAWHRRKVISLTLWVYVAFLVAALLIDYRERLAAAIFSGVLLWLATRFNTSLFVPGFMSWLGRISYSLFLIHFAVGCGLMAYLEAWIDREPARAIFAVSASFAASVFAGAILHYKVELPWLAWLKQDRLTTAPDQLKIAHKALRH